MISEERSQKFIVWIYEVARYRNQCTNALSTFCFGDINLGLAYDIFFTPT